MSVLRAAGGAEARPARRAEARGGSAPRLALGTQVAVGRPAVRALRYDSRVHGAQRIARAALIRPAGPE